MIHSRAHVTKLRLMAAFVAVVLAGILLALSPRYGLFSGGHHQSAMAIPVLYWMLPQLDGTGEIRLESADRAAGYWTTRSDTHPEVNARTSGFYLRANPEDLSILDDGMIGSAPS
jgi:hypothetical protein